MLQVALIGYGYWGPNLARVWNENKRTRLKYICDLKQDRLAAAKVNYSYIQPTSDYMVVLKDEEVEAVNITTSINSHFQIAKEALLHDKHILVEKPLTASSREMEEIMELADKRKRIVMVGHTFLFSPATLKIKELIKKGVIGNIDFIQLSRINLGKIKHDFNVIWDLAPHDFSILDFWLEDLPLWIQVVGKAAKYKNVCDVAFINLEYPGNILVNIHLSWLSPVKIRQSFIVGQKQMIVYDDAHSSEKVKIYDSGVDIIKEPSTFGEFQLTYRTGDIHTPHLENVEPLKAECDHFIDCIQSKAKPRTDTIHALKIINMIEAAQKSLNNNGERVYFNNHKP